ncbi:MAG: leucine-rich repeat protein [Paludibacteraceae bacterium]|nr:leucine-rich repeat protein [Paludibacteraceae bacterium]
MKTKLFTLLLAVAASVGTMFAEKVQIGDLYYNLDATSQTAEVTHQNSRYPYWSTTITTAIIPASVEYNSVTYSVTSIGGSAFWGCSGLTSVTIGNSVTSIGSQAFQYCTGLTSVTIPNSVTSIGNYAFSNVANIIYSGSATGSPWEARSVNGYVDGYLVYSDETKTNLLACSSAATGDIDIPNSVTSIGNSAFDDCSGLTSVTIPNSVTSIGNYAFAYCRGLTSVTIDAETPPTLGMETFDNTNNCPIYVPCGTLGVYKTAWTNYASRISYAPLPNKISTQAEYGSVGITSLENYTICDEQPYHYTLTVTANYGYHFTQWSDGNTDNPRVVQTTQDTTFTAEFARNPTITYVFDSKMGTVTGPAMTATGIAAENITFNATPYYGYHFVQWSDGNTDNPRTIWLSQDTTFTAEFAKNTYTISTTSANPEWGTTAGDTAALYLDEVEISATANYGYHFVKWNEMNSIPDNSITVADAIKAALELAENTPSSNQYIVVGYIVGKYGSYYNSYYIADTPDGESTFVIYKADNSASIGEKVMISGYLLNYYGTPEIMQGGKVQPVNHSASTANPYTLTVTEDKTYIANFAKNVYSITANAEHGSISGSSSAEYLDYVTLTVTPDYGYHFTQWSDGLKDNPRIFQITKDTTFTAEFAYDRVGTCGKDLALTWSYDPTNKVLTIGNAGEFTENMRFGVEAPNEMEELVIGNNVTAIGENAFANISTLKKVTIGEAVKTIYNNAFYNCVNLETIFNYRPTPTNAYSTAFDGVDKFACSLYVLPSSIDMYKNASVWRDFYYTYAIGAEEATLLTNDVKVEPQDNAATVTWPTSENAATYTIEITKDGEVFCTLIFNGNGQLTGIAFAPSRDGQAHAPAAIMTANGLQFTVTGLNSATHYALTLQAKDDQNAVLASYSSEFTTTGTATAVDNVPSDQVQSTKILRDGTILILRGEKTYSITGSEIR